MGVIGCLANVTVLCVLLSSKKARGETVNMFILNQTVLDMLACFLMIVITSVGLSGVTEYNLILCILIGGGATTSSAINASAWSLIVITVERYVKVVHPVYHRTHYRRWMTYAAMPLCWLLGMTTCAQADFVIGRNCLSIPLRIGKVCMLA
jgi:hypothetical protein